jgi:hypothetical protein
MVREWGMSGELGPMAWGSQGMVFLGEDLMHTRDYSEDTSRVIDAEVAKILREQEERALDVLTRHRRGLEAVAEALLRQETVDGASVGSLVDEAYGRPVHPVPKGGRPDPQVQGVASSSTADQGPPPVTAPVVAEAPVVTEAPVVAESGSDAPETVPVATPGVTTSPVASASPVAPPSPAPASPVAPATPATSTSPVSGPFPQAGGQPAG